MQYTVKHIIFACTKFSHCEIK